MKVRKAVIPAAGLGTRFLPATKASPKEMLPVVDKPVIQYVMEEAVAAGIESVLIITGRGKDAIENHFDVSAELEAFLEAKGKRQELEQVRAIASMVEVTYIRQKEALGLGHAVLCARTWVGHEPFAVFLGDDIVVAKEPCIAQLLRVFGEKNASVLGVMDVAREETRKYGIVAGSEEGSRTLKISDIVEKPDPKSAPSTTAVIGRYVFTPEIFDQLEQTRADGSGEIQLTNAIRSLMSVQPVYAYRFEGRRYDAGDKLGFLEATVEMALARPDLGQPFRAYLKRLASTL
ncbi:MAG: UTP--glucose-1-phosphate uridylyltransferase GalU [Acidobacteria bacterium]|nr:UTP--glucose-1-phosphate uridylyltransferase GalU [Acidobacteriota bacterium]